MKFTAQLPVLCTVALVSTALPSMADPDADTQKALAEMIPLILYRNGIILDASDVRSWRPILMERTSDGIYFQAFCILSSGSTPTHGLVAFKLKPEARGIVLPNGGLIFQNINPRATGHMSDEDFRMFGEAQRDRVGWPKSSERLAAIAERAREREEIQAVIALEWVGRSDGPMGNYGRPTTQYVEERTKAAKDLVERSNKIIDRYTNNRKVMPAADSAAFKACVKAFVALREADAQLAEVAKMRARLGMSE